MPAPPIRRTASAVAPTVISKPIQSKDPTSITKFPTTTNPFSFELGKHPNIREHALCVPPLLLSTVLPESTLNPAAVSFPNKSLLNPTAEPYHPPSASSDPPSLPAPLPASPDSPLVVAPESQHDKLDFLSTVPLQPNVVDPSVIPHDELDDLIQASVNQFLSSEDWTQFVESARDPKSDWANDLSGLDHLAAELLSYYKKAGIPVVPTPESTPWNQGKREAALA